MNEKVPTLVRHFTDEEVLANTEKYRAFALSLGATDAKAIPADHVFIDSRVRIKCSVPRCSSYGHSANCPPFGIQTQETVELVSKFRYALLVKLELEPSKMVGKELKVTKNDKKTVVSPGLRDLLHSYRDVSDIVTRIESTAFYDGHYFATAFSAGTCRAHYCNYMECAVIKGEPCRFPLRARPSMEGSGMDVFRTAAEAGWEIYPVGKDCHSDDIPKASLMGLVLID
jgi:predicted metal-binding protein